MRLYHIKDEYIAYLRTKDERVLKNKDERRPYVGVVLEINDFTYYVPLSSPKPKHKTMKNAKDFHKIGGGTYGAINFNKMIPVPNDCIVKFRFEDEKDPLYKSLLQNQYKVINTMGELIKRKSRGIYRIFHTADNNLTPSDIRVKQRCVDFHLLEEMCKEYIKRNSGL
jgi:protein AbiQ